jgi:TRAP-type mannitol/chloroaromatic compound transport system permease small subunit
MAALVRTLDWINEAVGRVMGWLTVLMVLNVFLVVVMRYVFSAGYVWMQELYVWTHAGIFLAGAGYTLLHDGHVRIDLIYRDASPRYKAWVNIFGSVFLAAPLLYMLFVKSWPIVQRSWAIAESSGEAGGLPALYILKSMILVFCILMGLQVALLIARSLLTLITGEQVPLPGESARIKQLEQE